MQITGQVFLFGLPGGGYQSGFIQTTQGVQVHDGGVTRAGNNLFATHLYSCQFGCIHIRDHGQISCYFFSERFGIGFPLNYHRFFIRIFINSD